MKIIYIYVMDISTKMEQKRVAILGGSFNPPHLAHIEICKYLLNRNLCNQVWIMPCLEHPFGKVLADYEHRLAMCRFTFQEFGEKVWVTDIERSMGGVSHTIRTIQHFKFQYPDTSFSLVIGDDVKNEKDAWKDFDEITKMISLIEVPRGPKSPIPDISSTEIRRRIRENEKNSDLVVLPVAVYIVTHSLYHE